MKLVNPDYLLIATSTQKVVVYFVDVTCQWVVRSHDDRGYGNLAQTVSRDIVADIRVDRDQPRVLVIAGGARDHGGLSEARSLLQHFASLLAKVDVDVLLLEDVIDTRTALEMLERHVVKSEIFIAGYFEIGEAFKGTWHLWWCFWSQMPTVRAINFDDLAGVHLRKAKIRGLFAAGLTILATFSRFFRGIELRKYGKGIAAEEVNQKATAQ